MVSPSTSGCTMSDWPAGPSGLIQRTRPTRPAAPDHERSIAPASVRRATGAVCGAQLDDGHCRHPRQEDADGVGEMGIWRPPPFDVRADNRADDQALKHIHGRSRSQNHSRSKNRKKTITTGSKIHTIRLISRRRRSISSRSLSVCGPLTLISSGRAPSFSVGEIIQRDKRHGRVGSR